MNDNIILIGFMGCGKTSVGLRLSEHMGFSFLDTDEKIEALEGRKITDIFAKEGEGHFRKLETKMLGGLLEETQKTVLSTGGGLPLRPENGKLLQQLGFVVYLDVTKETVLERLSGDQTRPLLNGPDRETKVDELLEFRRPIYEYTAHMAIDVNQKSIDEIVDEIVRNYRIIKKESISDEVKGRSE